jgi:hypothetical protein
MARGRSNEDLTTLEMALVGYQIEKQKIEDKIRDIQSQLGGKSTAKRGAKRSRRAGGGGRVLSAEARKRIATAQKKRWAEHRKRVAAAAKQSPAKKEAAKAE